MTDKSRPRAPIDRYLTWPWLLTVLGLWVAILLVTLMVAGAIPVTQAQRLEHEQSSQARMTRELEERRARAKQFGDSIEYFRDETAQLCFAHRRMVSSGGDWSQFSGPVDCALPGVAEKLKNDISGH